MKAYSVHNKITTTKFLRHETLGRLPHPAWGPGFGAFQNSQGQAEGSGMSTTPFTQAQKRFFTESDSAWTHCQKSPLALSLAAGKTHGTATTPAPRESLRAQRHWAINSKPTEASPCGQLGHSQYNRCGYSSVFGAGSLGLFLP